MSYVQPEVAAQRSIEDSLNELSMPMQSFHEPVQQPKCRFLVDRKCAPKTKGIHRFCVAFFVDSTRQTFDLCLSVISRIFEVLPSLSVRVPFDLLPGPQRRPFIACGYRSVQRSRHLLSLFVANSVQLKRPAPLFHGPNLHMHLQLLAELQ